MPKWPTMEQYLKGLEIGGKIAEGLATGAKAGAKEVLQALEGETPESCGGFVGIPAKTARDISPEISSRGAVGAAGRSALLRWGMSPWIAGVRLETLRSGNGRNDPVVWQSYWTIVGHAYKENGLEEGIERMRAAWRWSALHGDAQDLLGREAAMIQGGLQEMSPAEGLVSTGDERALKKAKIWLGAKAERDAAVGSLAGGALAAKEIDDLAREAIGRKSGAAKKSGGEKITAADRERLKTLRLLGERAAEDPEAFALLWASSPRIKAHPAWIEGRFGSSRETLLGTAMRLPDKAALFEMLALGANPWLAAAHDDGALGRNPFAWAAIVMGDSQEALDRWALGCLRGAHAAFGEDPKGKCEREGADAKELLERFHNKDSPLRIARMLARIQSERLGEALGEEAREAPASVRKRPGL